MAGPVRTSGGTGQHDAGLRARGQSVRQGTIQRWVRDCDSITDPGLRVKLLHAVSAAPQGVRRDSCTPVGGASTKAPGLA